METNLHRLKGFIQKSEALPLLTAIGLLTGLFTGLFLLLFKGLIVFVLSFFMDGTDDFESLSEIMRFALVFGGGLILATFWHFTPPSSRAVGVSHVLGGLQKTPPKLPASNLISQFFGGILTLSSGQSAGKEGPALHLGASLAALFGNSLNLPTHSIRVMAGCGVAGAIAAFFDTPLAGVIFALEVILIEYSISWAVPIMASAFTAALVSRLIWPPEAFFPAAQYHLTSFSELLFLSIMGFAIGCLAAGFNALIRFFLRFRHQSVFIRISIASLVTACIGFFLPQVLGTGYDSINMTLNNQLAITLLIMLLAFKVLATSITIGLGIPGGLIGPSLVIGALAGGLFFSMTQTLLPEGSNIAIFALVGTASMMSAVLQAPLTALVTVLEFSANTAILFPAMIALVIANLTCRTLFNQPSIFISILQTQGLTLSDNPINKALRSVELANAGIPSPPIIQSQAKSYTLENLLGQQEYLIIECNNRIYCLEQAYAQRLLDQEKSIPEPAEIIDLSTWVNDQNELLWLPPHSSLDEVIRTIQGRNIAGIWTAPSNQELPERIFPKKYVIEFLTRSGE